jgi:hypothetical protein
MQTQSAVRVRERQSAEKKRVIVYVIHSSFCELRLGVGPFPMTPVGPLLTSLNPLSMHTFGRFRLNFLGLPLTSESLSEPRRPWRETGTEKEGDLPDWKAVTRIWNEKWQVPLPWRGTGRHNMTSVLLFSLFYFPLIVILVHRLPLTTPSLTVLAGFASVPSLSSTSSSQFGSS